MVEIAFFRRLLGQDDPRRDDETPLEPVGLHFEPVVAAPPAPSVACPNCGVLLDPPPTSSRLCPRCRRKIVVRHTEGRAIYLTEAAVEVFEAERQREIDARTWERERRSWLQLARLVAAPADRRQRLAAVPLSLATVEAARALYLSAADRGAREARQEKRWEDVARIRQRQAAALFEDAGGRPPVPAEILDLYRDGINATLRGLAALASDVELVGASCCTACRADNERIFPIADELRVPRLPHPDCPRGLCACDWWPTVRQAKKKKARRRTATTAPLDAPADRG
ncbi:MAG TPA: hypothetical protein VGJ17_00170 [Candidatus Limnocylindrales bacterium]